MSFLIRRTPFPRSLFVNATHFLESVVTSPAESIRSVDYALARPSMATASCQSNQLGHANANHTDGDFSCSVRYEP